MFFNFDFRWLYKSSTNQKELSVHSVVEEAVRTGAQDYLIKMREIRNLNQENDEENLQNILKCVTLIRADLQKGTEYYDHMFKEYVLLFSLVLWLVCEQTKRMNQ